MTTTEEALAELAPPPETNGTAIPRRRSLRRKEIPIEIEDEQGLVSVYTLREMDGTQRDSWIARGQQRGVTAEGRVKNMTGMIAELLSLTLYDPSGMLVPVKTIQTWPASLQWELFQDSQELSALNPKAQEQAKNA